MINNRYRRSSKPVESLKQFDITANKGIDVTASPTANGTYSYIENFDIAEDGSLELRKPMVLSRSFIKQTVYAPYSDQHINEYRTYRIYRVFPTYDKDKLLLVYKCEDYPGEVHDDTGYWGISIYDRETGTYSAPVKFIGYLYATRKQIGVDIPSVDGVGVVPINLSEANLTTTYTSCILTNCKVCTRYTTPRYNLPALNIQHYVSFPDTSFDYENFVRHTPRNIQIYQNDAGEWLVKVISAEIPNLVSADGELPIDPRLAADNPYALRDTYNSPYPTVKGIVAYTYGRKNPDGTYSPIDKKNVCLTVTRTVTHTEGTVSYSYSPSQADIYAYDYYTRTMRSEWAVVNPHVLSYTFAINVPTYVSTTWYGDLVADVYTVEGQYIGSISGTPERYGSDEDEDTGIAYNFRITSSMSDISMQMEFYFAGSDSDYNLDPNRSPILEMYRNGRVAQLTEDVSTPEAFAIVNTIGDDAPLTVLKAFCNFKPESSSTYNIYAFWEQSSDGKEWNDFPPLTSTQEMIIVKVPNPYYDINGEETTPPEGVETTYRSVRAYKFTRPTMYPRYMIIFQNASTSVPL